jgi:hypothetical protein
MKKNPRKVRWTGAFRRTHGKDLTVDTTFDFERKQNRPVRYDRNLYISTIRAMKRIQQIRLRRERLHYRQRIHAAKVKLTEAIEKVLFLRIYCFICFPFSPPPRSVKNRNRNRDLLLSIRKQ